MRLAYGVHGYGRGHAVRSLAVLSRLTSRHEVLVLAGGDAAPLLRRYRPLPLPAFTFGYHGTRLSAARTLRANAALLAALALAGPPVARIERLLDSFRPEVVVSDSEPLVLRAAGRLGIPRLVFDHVGVVGWCRPPAPLGDALRLGRDGLAYRLLMGNPERVVVSSFFDAPPRRADVRVVPPVLRERVLRAEAADAGHLLVYLNQPRLLTPAVLSAIAGAGAPAVVYGAGRLGREGAVRFRAIDEAAFVDDLASCRAVLATAGHQLAAEALHLGKPLLLCPEDSAEQRLNARELVRLGAARVVRPRELSADLLRAFLAGATPRGGAAGRIRRDGNDRALEVLEEQLAALAAPPSSAPQASSAGARALCTPSSPT
ncbi:MAG TPA: glycosyltransferase family protein [Anaeromyxobacter sp.]|nr:glycosyltransferase family protein [Anaeromyxobacter sp.]